jgi:hypothetical protein
MPIFFIVLYQTLKAYFDKFGIFLTSLRTNEGQELVTYFLNLYSIKSNDESLGR